MGLDSIDFEFFRFSIPALSFWGYPSPQFLLDTLLEPVISQHPGLVGRFSYFCETIVRYALLKKLAVGGLSFVGGFVQTLVLKVRGYQFIGMSLRIVTVT